jgi:hypothetical protein
MTSSGTLFQRLRAVDGSSFNSAGFVPIDRHVACMPACKQNVKKREARRIKNDRLQAAKKAVKAKS